MKVMTTVMCVLALCVLCAAAMAQDADVTLAQPWQTEYTGEDATGDHVIGLWQFNDGAETADSSSNNFELNVEGAEFVGEGKFGGSMESFRGWPEVDDPHRVWVKDYPKLSPKGPFTIEMWISPKAELADYPDAFLFDKRYVSENDYQLILESPDSLNQRRLRLVLGFGDDSKTFRSDAVVYEAGEWYHIAATYDAAGTVQFFRNGTDLGSQTIEDVGAISPGNRKLSIGDRIGSYYHGFPGYIDQVRLSEGVLEFRSAAFELTSDRTAFVRMEENAKITFGLTNLRREPLKDATATIIAGYVDRQEIQIPTIPSGQTEAITYTLNTALRPGKYTMVASVDIPGEHPYSSQQTFPVHITKRPLPHRMPVVMWGVYNPQNILENLDILKYMGFTHSLGLGKDLNSIWEAQKPVTAVDEVRYEASAEALNQLQVEGLQVAISLSAGRSAAGYDEQYLQVGKDGEPYEDRASVNGLHERIQDFCYNVGASVAQTWGKFPAFDAALIHSEVRGHSKPSFAEIDHRAFKEFAGFDIPKAIPESQRGVQYESLEDFPADRVIPDDHPIRVYYSWWWEHGDGWNTLHTRLHEGLQQGTKADFWTWHDPAVRVASKWGNGGNVDILSQWTYSYPDPIRIGLATDELFAMAEGAGKDQDVMKMTQIIWYRSQTAPQPDEEAQQVTAEFEDKDTGPQQVGQVEEGQYRARWEQQIPDARFITIAPMHLREAFWTKIARPIKGIMYHGWQSLVEVGGHSSYRYTHPGTKEELRRLVNTVVEPLGPTLVQVPDYQTDVACLESFTSQMFAGRGTYGWNGGWGGDSYLIMMYAQLQPEVVYEETINRDDLDRYKILAMMHCDVLPESIVEKVQAFQDRGGIVIGDEFLCPAIKPDIVIESHDRPEEADVARQMNIEKAQKLREELDEHYKRYVGSTTPDVITRVRRYGSADYVFGVNDLREYGDYVGHHGLVMERGLPTDAKLYVNRDGGYVYDLVAHRKVENLHRGDGFIGIFHHFGPCEGALYMITDRPIDRVDVDAPDTANPGEQVEARVSIVDESGDPLDAVIPVDIEIRDGDGQLAEYSGYYGAKDGTVQLSLDIAPNARPGMWQVRATDLASGRVGHAYFRVSE